MLDGKDVGLPANINNVPFFGEQIREMNMIPCGYHRYYYRQQEMLEHSLMEYETIGTRGQQVKETENKLFELYKNPNLDHKPEELSKRGGAYYSDAACECINAIYNNKQTHMVVSTKNRGAIPELPEDSIVEVSCYIGAKGAMPVAWGKLPSAQRGWLQCMKAMEECTIEAAVTGNYGLALEAFTLNELIPSGENAKRVLDELLIAHKNYLPQFKSTIEKLEKEFEKLAKTDVEKFCKDVAKELAARLLSKVIPRTPVGEGTFEVINEKKYTIKSGGTLRRGWTANTEAEAESGSVPDPTTYADSLKIFKFGNNYIVIVENPVKYASYVEYGHRQEPGRYVPALGKRLKQSWVEGKYMLTISEKELESQLPAILEQKMKKYIEECLNNG